ncbi:MAG: AAA family ATPase, partial [Bdellovibrionota bacterium]
GKVLYLNSRDGPRGILRPRLEAAGADLAHVRLVEYPRVTLEEKGKVRLDLEALSGLLAREKPRLLIIDPIDPYVEKKAGRLSEALANLAGEHDCTILAVRRLPRTPAGRPVRMGAEDLDFWADSVFLVAKDPDDPKKRIVAHVRHAFEAEGNSVDFEIKDGQIRWGNYREITADELLHPPKGEASERPSALREAQAFLRKTLGDGREWAKRVLEMAAYEGISRKTLQRAKKSLGVKSVQQVSFWYWELPEEAAENPDLAENDGSLGHLGQEAPVEPLKLNRAERRRMERTLAVQAQIKKSGKSGAPGVMAY